MCLSPYHKHTHTHTPLQLIPPPSAPSSSAITWVTPPPLCDHSWLLVYGLLTLGVIVIALARSSLFFWAAMRAATRLHGAMLAAVLRAPLSFFHTNPTGRVLNRFSNDQGRVDDVLPLALFDVLQTGLVCLGAFVLVAVAVPFIMPVFGALLVAFYFYRCVGDVWMAAGWCGCVGGVHMYVRACSHACARKCCQVGLVEWGVGGG